jgi:hypothetical protein
MQPTFQVRFIPKRNIRLDEEHWTQKMWIIVEKIMHQST